jgi:4-hydroxy-4-methyl-2-oxoglutarate aldolase
VRREKGRQNVTVTNPGADIPSGIVEEFRAIDCASVADAVRALGLNCVVQGLYPVNPDWKICGRAVTMRQIPLQDPGEWDHAGTDIAELREISNPGDVIVVEAGGRLDVAIFGGGSAGRLQSFGIGGVVIDGACRDRLELLEIGCPTFVAGVSLVHPEGFLRTVSVNSEPVRIGTAPGMVSVAPGDLVVGDMDGVAVVPAARAEEVLRRAQQPHA